MKILTNEEVGRLAMGLARVVPLFEKGHKVFPIPRGGIPAALAFQAASHTIKDLPYTLVDNPEEADFFLDDIIDSGTTRAEWYSKYPNKSFYALIDKTSENDPYRGEWVRFPWEDTERSLDDTVVGTLTNRLAAANAPFKANDNIASFLRDGEVALLQNEVERRAEHFLRGLVIDVDNDHNTVGTAKRMAKMYLHEVFKGRYSPSPVITDFPNAKGLDEMYMTGPITIRSACSHHFVPIVGRCWIGVIPGERVIGLSKFNRIVDWIASRPQIQEEMVMQIADFIEQQIQPKGLAVVVEATHLCMTWRGVREPMEAKMTTNVMRGVFRGKPEARAEFMTLVAKG